MFEEGKDVGVQGVDLIVFLGDVGDEVDGVVGDDVQALSADED